MLCVPLLNSVHTKTSATSQNYFQVLDFLITFLILTYKTYVNIQILKRLKQV